MFTHPMFDRERLGPPYDLATMMDRNNISYGNEWSRDIFDQFADIYLLKTLTSENSTLRALDIGSGRGRKIEELAKLEIFGKLFASDIEFRPAMSATISSCTIRFPRSPVEFLKKNILDLTQSNFGDHRLDYINCRNVIHFLAPQHVPAAIDIMASLAAPRALVTISFDKWIHGRKDQSRFLSIGDNVDDFYSRYSEGSTIMAPLQEYSAEEFVSLLEEKDFTILPEPASLNQEMLRKYECRIAALAPG